MALDRSKVDELLQCKDEVVCALADVQDEAVT